MQIGITELIVVFVIALFALGPDRLPAYAKKLGEAVAQFKKYSDEATEEIKKSVVEPLEEAQAPLREAVQPIEDLDRTMRDNVKEIRSSFAGIGKEKKTAAAPPTDGKEKEPEQEAGPAEQETSA